jgi:hypothetical protein
MKKPQNDIWNNIKDEINNSNELSDPVELFKSENSEKL